MPLSRTGRQQAEIMAKYVTENYRIDGIYASTLQRALNTARAIADRIHKEVVPDDRLREINVGDWDGRRYEELKEKEPEQFGLWQNDMSKVCIPNGESIFEVQKRGFAAIKEICENNDNKTVVIVSHRVMLRTIQCLWENRPLSQINDCEWISNCAVSEVLYEDGGLTPVKINQADFLGDRITKVSAMM